MESMEGGTKTTVSRVRGSVQQFTELVVQSDVQGLTVTTKAWG